MNVNVGTQWEKFIAENVQSGRYLSASEVIREGLRLLQEREQLRLARLERVTKAVNEGIRQLDRGKHVELDRQGIKKHLAGVKTRGRRRIAKKSAGGKS